MVTDTEPDTRPTTRRAPRERATDAAIIERSLREPERFAQVFDRYYAEVHGFVARRLGRSLADDVASETFVIAFDRRRRYDLAYPSARAWLYGIAANVIARHRRAEVRQYRALARTGVTPAVDADAERLAGRVDARAARRGARAGLRARPRGAAPRRVGAAELGRGSAGARHRGRHRAIPTVSRPAQDAGRPGRRRLPEGKDER
jgi:DNA-directed RNA polymerase specialized sigma24 family protein